MTGAAEIAAGLGLKRRGRAWGGACPSCGYRGTFEVQDRDGATVWRCHSCHDQGAVTEALRDAGLIGGDRVRRGDWTPPRLARESGDDGRATVYARELWSRALPAAGTVAETYLKARGLDGPIAPTLRFLPDCRHAPTGSRWPAMVAAVTRWPGREIVAIHRTFLAPDGSGKAPVDRAKMTLAPIGGGAVRLAAVTERLALAEGIETAFAGLAAGWPTWSAVCAGNLSRLILPALPLAAEIFIITDNDRSGTGMREAIAAADRFTVEGRQVRIRTTDKVGTDFNDVLCEATQ